MRISQKDLDGLVELTRLQRDLIWSKALGLPKTLSPQQAAEWLRLDRIERARCISDASRCKGHPKHY